MLNQDQTPDRDKFIFTEKGYITPEGAHHLLSAAEADVEFPATQYFLEESYRAIERKRPHHEVVAALDFSNASFGRRVTAAAVNLAPEEVELAFELSDEKWRQKSAKRLILMKHWVVANAIITQDTVLECSEGDTSKDRFIQGRDTLLIEYPELDGDIVPVYIGTSGLNPELIETLHSVLWHNYNTR